MCILISGYDTGGMLPKKGYTLVLVTFSLLKRRD